MSVMSKWPTSPARSGNSELGLSSNLEPHSVPASFNTHISASTVSACLKTGPFPYQHSPLTALTVWSSHHFQTHPYGYCYIVGFPVFQYITSPMISGFFRVKSCFLSSIHRYFEKSHEDSHYGIAILSILGGAVRKKVSCIPMSGSGLYPNLRSFESHSCHSYIHSPELQPQCRVYGKQETNKTNKINK